MEGTSVYDPNGKHIGAVKRMMIEKVSGQVAYVVLAFGGILGVGEDTHPIPWETLRYDTDLGGYRTDVTEEQVRGAPALFGEEGESRLYRDRERALHDYYGARYYWGI
ncbi:MULTISPECIES: PRC-barrel domain-containing protein [Microvirga]|uniref:PRC-barrel domain-containing protein n=1 Tax=Microvirga TaxID=186650 RepID=UPI00362347D6